MNYRDASVFPDFFLQLLYIRQTRVPSTKDSSVTLKSKKVKKAK